MRVTAGRRTWAEQQKLYDQGRTKASKKNGEGKVTNAKPGTSFHNYGLAFDVVEIDNKGKMNWNADWNKIGAMGKRYGFEWGGDWIKPVDRPHFQDKRGKTIKQHHKEYLQKKEKKNENITNILRNCCIYFQLRGIYGSRSKILPYSAAIQKAIV